MRAVLPCLAVVALSIAVFVHYGNRIPSWKQVSGPQSKESNPSNAEITEGNASAPAAASSGKMVTVVSPLEQLMNGSTAEKTPEQPTARKPHPSDLIAPSPVGTGGVILHKTFSLASAADFPFVIPAHAATPQLHGHYQSFSRQEGAPVSDEAAGVSFLLMSEEQYSDFVSRRPADTLFAVESSHNQDINFGLPASQSRPAKFYIVFRNSPGEGRKIVKADFTVDF